MYITVNIAFAQWQPLSRPDATPAALAHTKRSLTLWLQAAWPAFEASLNAEFMGFAEADAREGRAALKEKRTPRCGAVS